MPQIAFLELREKQIIPIKVFINRQRISNEAKKTVAVNQKSIITLKKVTHLKLSPKDLRLLCETIKPHLMKILIEDLLVDILNDIQIATKANPQSIYSGKYTTEVTTNQLGCTVAVLPELIVSFRQSLGLFSRFDEEVAKTRKVNMKGVKSGKVALLRKSMEFSGPLELILIEEPDSNEINWDEPYSGTTGNDDKKSILHKWQKTSTIGNYNYCVHVYLNRYH